MSHSFWSWNAISRKEDWIRFIFIFLASIPNIEHVIFQSIQLLLILYKNDILFLIFDVNSYLGLSKVLKQNFRITNLKAFTLELAEDQHVQQIYTSFRCSWYLHVVEIHLFLVLTKQGFILDWNLELFLAFILTHVDVNLCLESFLVFRLTNPSQL